MARVRPTLRALNDLGIERFPLLTTRLCSLEHPVIEKSQLVPDNVLASAADRFLALTDRMVFKFRSGDMRGAVVDLRAEADTPLMQEQPWWLAACGPRQRDSPQKDFYAKLERECSAKAKGSGADSDSSHLLPVELDWKRYMAELATGASQAVMRLTRTVIARSALNGAPEEQSGDGYRLTAHVRKLEGDTYLAICAEGFLDPNLLALILDSIPNVPASDWQAEPGEILGIAPGPGKIVYSTILLPETLNQILEEYSEE